MPNDFLSSTSIFKFLGLTNLSNEEELQMLEDINEIVWRNFFISRLPMLVTEVQMREIEGIVATYGTFDELIKKIMLYAPNFPLLLEESALDTKKEFIINHHQRRVDEINLLIDPNSSSPQTELVSERDQHIKAVNFASNDQWQDLAKLFIIKSN